MKKFLLTIVACALVLSFSGLTMAEEKKAEPQPAATAPAAAPAAQPAAVPAATAPETAPAASQATPDDMKWIAQCIIDNKNEGQTMEVVQKYCECMNSKMDDKETQSVTEWEKTHPKEQKECSDSAGWK